MDYSIKTLEQLRPILRGFRRARGLTQTALAAQLGITQQTYAELEANPASATLSRLLPILRMLGMELVFRDLDRDQYVPMKSPGTARHGMKNSSGHKLMTVLHSTNGKRQLTTDKPDLLEQKANSGCETTKIPHSTKRKASIKRPYLVVTKKSKESW